MRKLAFIVIAMLCCARSTNAQAPVYAPLSLFITGSGEISPFTDGQLLEVGQSYEMTATPDSGYLFSSWQPVNIFTFSEYTSDAQGNPTAPIISTVLSPTGQYIVQPVLDFTMQPVTEILDVPEVRTVTQSAGWQANFVPTPEPSIFALIVCGLGAICFLPRTRLKK